MRLLRPFFSLFLAVILLGLAGCASSSKKSEPQVALARFFLEALPNEAGGVARLPDSGVVIQIEPKAQFTELDIDGVEVVDGELGKAFAFRLTQQAGTDLYKMSVPNQGRRIVTVVNNIPIGARRIDGPLTQGYIITYVEVPEDKIAELALNITRSAQEARAKVQKSLR
jgi:hypothetical protein